MEYLKKYWILYCTTGAFFMLDYATKWWAQSEHFQPFILVKNLLYFTLQKNSGIAFGIPLPRSVQILTSLIILTILIVIGYQFLEKSGKQLLKQILFGIIIGGAIGNLINRIMSGYVIDFIALKPFPVFNIADIGITIGLILLFLLTLNPNKNGKTNDT